MAFKWTDLLPEIIKGGAILTGGVLGARASGKAAEVGATAGLEAAKLQARTAAEQLELVRQFYNQDVRLQWPHHVVQMGALKDFATGMGVTTPEGTFDVAAKPPEIGPFRGSAGTGLPGGGGPEGGDLDAALIAGEAGGNRVSTPGRVVRGAGSGAAIGATVGSVIPGIGTAVGAGVGALVGGIKSLIGRGRKEADQIVPYQNALTSKIGQIEQDLSAKISAGTATDADWSNALGRVTQLRDEFFGLTQKFGRAGPGARRTIGSWVDPLLSSWQNRQLRGTAPPSAPPPSAPEPPNTPEGVMPPASEEPRRYGGPVYARRRGGVTRAPQRYLVDEAGEELYDPNPPGPPYFKMGQPGGPDIFVPPEDGMILPNSSLKRLLRRQAGGPVSGNRSYPRPSLHRILRREEGGPVSGGGMAELRQSWAEANRNVPQMGQIGTDAYGFKSIATPVPTGGFMWTPIEGSHEPVTIPSNSQPVAPSFTWDKPAGATPPPTATQPPPPPPSQPPPPPSSPPPASPVAVKPQTLRGILSQFRQPGYPLPPGATPPPPPPPPPPVVGQDIIKQWGWTQDANGYWKHPQTNATGRWLPDGRFLNLTANRVWDPRTGSLTAYNPEPSVTPSLRPPTTPPPPAIRPPDSLGNTAASPANEAAIMRYGWRKDASGNWTHPETGDTGYFTSGGQFVNATANKIFDPRTGQLQDFEGAGVTNRNPYAGMEPPYTPTAGEFRRPWQEDFNFDPGASGYQPFNRPFEFDEAGKGYQPFNKNFAFNMEDLYKDPGYQFRVNEGEKRVERLAAAGGFLKSGATLKELVRYGQNMAAQEFPAARARAEQDFERNYGQTKDAYIREQQQFGLSYQQAQDAYNRALDEYIRRYNIFEQQQKKRYERQGEAGGALGGGQP